MTVSGKCPTLGEGWLLFLPKELVGDTNGPKQGDVDDIKASHSEIQAHIKKLDEEDPDFEHADGP